MPVEEDSRRLAPRVEASGPLVRGIRVGPPQTIGTQSVDVEVRELQGVDAANRPVGPAYRLEYEEFRDIHDLKDPRGAPLASASNPAWGWATPHAAGDLRARGQAEGLKGFRSGPPKTVARNVPVVTQRELQAVDYEARPVGRAYRLVNDDTQREQTVLDPDGERLGVVAGKGFHGSEYGLCWAERLVERDLRRGPERGPRAYEVSAGVDDGTQYWHPIQETVRVEARTSAEALEAAPGRYWAAAFDGGEHDLRITASAVGDPADRSHVASRVEGRAPGPSREGVERAPSFER